MAYTSPEVEERFREDIVDRLRVLNFMGPWKEAADEIERLRLANSDLQMYYDYARDECDKLQSEVLRLLEELNEKEKQ